jgi:TetR/AcrR family transcriptional repressor of nem operon
MRVSRKQVEENKQTILTAAGRLFRERGFDAVTVTDIMKSAGLTHGGFYGYFKSKDDLIAQTLAELKIENDAAKNDVVAQIERYLSPNIGIILPAAARWRRWRRRPSASPNPRVTK